MARLVRINEERNRAEREAQERLAQVLPSSWIVTTNIKEFNFQRKRRELDSLLICPFGLFVLDFKNHGGRITPQTNQAWGGVQEQKNPFSQGQDALYSIKDKLESSHSGEKWWVEWLVVMTNPRVVLDWAGSDCDDALRLHVCLVDDVQEHVERIAGKVRLHAPQASLVLQAFKPPELASHLSFIEQNWRAPEPEPSRSTWSPQPEIDWSSVARRYMPRTPPSQPIPSRPSVVDKDQLTSPPYATRAELTSDTKTFYILGIVACACVLLFSLFKLTYCDEACESSRAARAHQVAAAKAQVERQIQEQNRVAEMAKRNMSPGCPGQVVTEIVGSTELKFNPNNCAWVFKVLQGRVRVAVRYWLLQKYFEVGPEGVTNTTDPIPGNIDTVRAANGFTSGRWQYLFCKEWTPSMNDWKCS